MNEDYMKQFRKVPDSEFVKKVYTRLERKERIRSIQQHFIRSVLVLIFVFGMLMTFSSTVRAQVINLWVKIAGLPFIITNDYPSDAYILVPSANWSLDEARTRFASPISIPAYVPHGYERSSAVEHILDGYVDLLTITWENHKYGEDIYLNIQHCFPEQSNGCGTMVGEGTVEEIMVNGKPAALIRAHPLNLDTHQFDSSTGVGIRWLYSENTAYGLTYYGKDLPLEELVKMAESIP